MPGAGKADSAEGELDTRVLGRFIHRNSLMFKFLEWMGKRGFREEHTAVILFLRETAGIDRADVYRVLSRARSQGYVQEVLWVNPGFRPDSRAWDAFMLRNGDVVTDDQFRDQIVQMVPDAKGRQITGRVAQAVTTWAVKGYRVTPHGRATYLQAVRRECEARGDLPARKPDSPSASPVPPATSVATPVPEAKEDPAPRARGRPSASPWAALNNAPTGFQLPPSDIDPDPDPPPQKPRHWHWDLPPLHDRAELRGDRFSHRVLDAKDCEPPPPDVIARNRLF